MKKACLITTVIWFLMTTVNARLANTKWIGEAHLLQPDKSLVTANGTWDLGKDIVNVFFAGGGEPEVLSYSVQKNIVTMNEISGGSPCDKGAEGKLKFEINDDKLFLSVVETNCEAFTKALVERPYMKVK